MSDIIYRTEKKKSFLKCFASPEMTRSNTSSQRDVREPQSPSQFLVENPDFYTLAKSEKPKKINMGVKRALVGNAKIDQFF